MVGLQDIGRPGASVPGLCADQPSVTSAGANSSAGARSISTRRRGPVLDLAEENSGTFSIRLSEILCGVCANSGAMSAEV